MVLFTVLALMLGTYYRNMGIESQKSSCKLYHSRIRHAAEGCLAHVQVPMTVGKHGRDQPDLALKV